RKIIPGAIDVHPTDSAIIVNYTVQATILGENGQPVVGDRKVMQKVIRVKALHANSNLAALAQEVVDKCKLIHPSRVRDVEQTLYYLQQRQTNDGGMDSNRVWLRKQLEEQRRDDEQNRTPSTKPSETPSIANIEHYIEGLYEEIPDKIQSTRNILQLARMSENMETLISNDALMSALSRVLREDGKKSLELVTNIIYIFFCFSNFSQFHPLITANKVGDMCLRLTEQELQRFELWEADLEGLERKCEQNPHDRHLIAELDQEHRKFQTMIRKQDQLLFVSFHLLLNLAEDLNIEVKMIKRGIIKYLIIMLSRKTSELQILVVTFLKKLSVFRENKDEMVKMADELIQKIDQMIPCEHQGLQNLILRLLLNLSHDVNFRTALIRNGFLGKLVELTHNRNHLLVTLQLLYMLSIDDRNKGAFAFTDAIPLVMKMILEFKGERVSTELMALAINIAANQRNAEVICQDGGLKFLVKRAIKTRDSLLLKMVRNLAQHEGPTKMNFLDHIDDFMHVLQKSTSNPELLVELLGILSSLNIPDFDFVKLAEGYNLLEFISRRIADAAAGSASVRAPVVGVGGQITSVATGTSEMAREGVIAEDDDVTLEVVMLLGTMANDENLSPIVARTGILMGLMDLMIAKEEDDEIILQIIYCIYQFLLHDATRTVLITKTQVVSYLIDLLYDRNVEIRKMCDVCLDIIAEIDDEWVKKIRQQKFQWHNSEWLQLIMQASSHGANEHLAYEESAVLYSSKPMPDNLAASSYSGIASQVGSRQGGSGGFDPDSEDEEDEFGSSMMIGGTSALLDGP
ncbi:kinesin-associated protein-domain-containing protein, partial [Blyttiomyces helicus]